MKREWELIILKDKGSVWKAVATCPFKQKGGGKHSKEFHILTHPKDGDHMIIVKSYPEVDKTEIEILEYLEENKNNWRANRWTTKERYLEYYNRRNNGYG